MKNLKLKQLIKEEIFKILNEGKQVGTLYHFTSISWFKDILISNQLKTGGRYISFTRNKNLFINPPKLGGGGLHYCFVVDGDKLSTKYKFEPFNDPVTKKDEDEERVVFKRNGMFIDNFNKYVKKIIIIGDVVLKYKYERTPDNINQVIEDIKKYMDVPVEIIFKESYPYKLDKSLTKFQNDILKKQKPKKNTFTTLKYIPPPTDPEEKIQQYIRDKGRYLNIDLDLKNTPISSLPDNLTVHGTLFLNDTPNLKSLPNNLTAKWIIIRRGQISSIPYNLNVDRLMIEDIPLLKKYNYEQIKKMIEDKGGKVKKVSD